MRRINFERAASICVVVIGGGFLLYLCARFIFALFLPFILALALAALTRPLVRFLADKTGWSLRVCAVLATLLFLLGLGVLLYLLFLRLFAEVQRLLDFLVEDGANENGSVARVIRFFRDLGARLPLVSRLQEFAFVREVLGDPSAYFTQQLQRLLAESASKLTGAVTALLGALPRVLFFATVTLIACFYVALDYDKVYAVLERLFPARIRANLPLWRQRLARAFKRCAKAYFLLFLLTFAELFLGLLLLRVGYPFLLALFCASLDVLPVLGVGTVLIPWGIFALLAGNTGRGVGLLILYAVITVIRQIAEPHLVGKSIGLHPVVMLVAFYAGITLFGMSGIVIGPLLAFFCKLLFDRVYGDEKV